MTSDSKQDWKVLTDCCPNCGSPDDAAARIRELLAQLPEGMEHCTIEFKECEHGHGRLVATNWVDHGCHVCRIRELEAERDEAVTQMIEAKVERDKAQDRVKLYRALIRAAQPGKPQQGE